MSRGQVPRTPDNFPRMNDRAGRRRYRRAVKVVTNPSFAETMRQIGDVANRLVDAFAEAFRPVAQQFTEMQRRLRDSLNNPALAAERIGRRMWAEQEAALPQFAEGGTIQGPRWDDDSIPVMLSPWYVSWDDGETWHEQDTE